MTHIENLVESFDLTAIMKNEQGIAPVRVTFVNRIFNHVELFGLKKYDFADLRGNIYNDLHDLGEMTGTDRLDLANL